MPLDRPYRTSELLTFVERLGREFKARGLSAEADSLRIYYWAIRRGHIGHGGDIRVVWSPDHILECYAESRTMRRVSRIGLGPGDRGLAQPEG